VLKQWEHHDYYLNDTFYLPTFLLVALSLSFISLSGIEKWKKYALVLLIALSGFYTTYYAINIKTKRAHMSMRSRTYTTYQNFEGTEAFLDSLGVSKDAKILVMDAYAPNLPFILMNRKGMAIISTTVRNLDEAMKWNFDLLALQDTFLLSDIYPNAPNIVNKFKKFASNGKVNFYTKQDNNTANLETFLGLDTTLRVFHAKENFEREKDTSYVSEWEYLRVVEDPYNKENHIMYLKNGEEFGMKWEGNCPGVLEEPSIMLFKGIFKVFGPAKIHIVANYGRFITNDTLYYIKTIDQQLYPFKKWRHIAVKIPLAPSPTKEHCTLKVYIWNEKKQKLLFDDISFSLYKREALKK